MPHYLLSLLILAFSGASAGLLAGQASPSNDACAKAIRIEPGQKISGQNNMSATVGFEFETPATFETTCIQTIENDMWYKFTTESDYEYYEVVISTAGCNTPAGLQALLIRSDDCNNKHYTYRACANKINTDTIFLYLHEPQAGLNYLIYVDGYDGTMCDFEVELRARKSLNPADYRNLRFDYEFDDAATYELPDLKTDFLNNQVVIEWAAEAEEDISFFFVELIPDLGPEIDDASRYARVVGILEKRNFVDAQRTFYEFRDYITPFQNDLPYSYRIVRIDGQGNRAASTTFSIQSKMIETFFVGEVRETPEEGIYTVHYINKKKKQNYRISVEDQNGKQLKNMVLEKVPATDGDVKIDMRENEKGIYFFEMSNGKESFKRQFNTFE
jgi:hypothetical protein